MLHVKIMLQVTENTVCTTLLLLQPVNNHSIYWNNEQIYRNNGLKHWEQKNRIISYLISITGSSIIILYCVCIDYRAT